MIEVRNILFQPLALHLAKGPGGMQEGLHLGPRERRRIRQDQLSSEIRKAADRGLVSLVAQQEKVAAVPPPGPLPASQAESQDEPDGAGPADTQSTATSRKRR
jgi:hypothetical protein